jgi:hypothetical protein
MGFAVAGLIAHGYQLATEKPLSFNLLTRARKVQALGGVALLLFGAPFVIMRNTIRGARIEKRRFESVMIATVIAGFWSLMSGTLVVNGWQQVLHLIGQA